MSNALSLIPVIGIIVSSIFGFLLLRQYINKKAPYQLAWAAAMFLFTLGFIGETLGLNFGWNQFSAKMYYLFGAILSVGYLSVGTLYLLKPKPAKWITSISLITVLIGWLLLYGLKYEIFSTNQAAALLGIAIYIATLLGVLFFSHTKSIILALIAITVLAIISLSQHSINIDLYVQKEVWGDVMSLPLRSQAFNLNIIGTFVIVIGAIYSAITGWSNEKVRPYMYNTIIIAVGVLIAALGGTLHGIFDIGKQAMLSLSTSVGIGVMLFGYLRNTRTR